VTVDSSAVSKLFILFYKSQTTSFFFFFTFIPPKKGLISSPHHIHFVDQKCKNGIRKSRNSSWENPLYTALVIQKSGRCEIPRVNGGFVVGRIIELEIEQRPAMLFFRRENWSLTLWET
jgi:hypothetical protein